MEAMEKATRVLQEQFAARQEREEIERQALADAMDVDIPAPVQQTVQNVLNYFQQNYNVFDHRQTHYTTNQLIQFLAQNTYQVNQQFNAGVDPRVIMYQAMQDAQRGHQHGLAVDDEGQLHITPPGPANAPAAGPKPKAKAKGQPKRRGRALTAGPAPVPAALAVAAAPSGPGTLIPWQKQQAVIAEPSSASAAASTTWTTPRVASGGATLVRPKLKQLGKTAQAQAKARAKAHAKAKAGPRPSVWASSEEDDYGGWEGRVG